MLSTCENLHPKKPKHSVWKVHTCGACLLVAAVFPIIHLDLYLIFSSLSHLPPISLAPTQTLTANFSFREPPSINFSIVNNIKDPCPYGRVYVYDLPPIFNQELINKCNELDLWNSRCEAVSNNGLGRTASELAGVLPESVAPAWHWTDQFMLEVIFHQRFLGHQCRTLEPKSATAFYIPFYAGLALGRYLWGNFSVEERDRDSEMLLNWLRDQPHWKISNGWDHFMVLSRITWDFRRWDDRGWGSRFLKMPAMQNVTRLLIERNPWDQLEIGVPYPTGFHPRLDSDVLRWQYYVRTHNRTTVFSFVGAPRGGVKHDFRGVLLSQCLNESNSCRVVDCSGNRCKNGHSVILEAFLDSDFCLQPRGDSYTRRSVFDCMVAGSIPVFFWERTAYDQYEWFLPSEPASYSVFINHNEVRNGTSIRRVLEKYSKEEIKKMREKVIDYIPKIVYAKHQNGLENVKDAFDIALDGVLRRFKKMQRVDSKQSER